MAITRYIAEAGLTASTPAVALQRLRNRRMVNRYDGSSVVDNGSAIPNVGTDSNITITSHTTIPVGYNVIVDRTVILEENFSANTNGVHMSFFNCTIILTQTAGNPGPFTVSTGALHTTPVQSSVDTGQANGRSLNFYGCNFIINPPGGNPFQMFSDFMDSTMTFSQPGAAGVGASIPLPSFVIGSRVINGTFYASAANSNAVFEIYGIPDVVEGLDIFRMSLEYAGAAGQGSLMFVEPNFSSPENQRRWRTQSPGADTLISSVGFYSTLDNTLANAFTSDNNAAAYFRTAGGANGGQLYNYYGWRPSFFSDVTQTNAIPGVRVRSSSNIPLNNTAQGLNAPEGNLSGAFSGVGGTINQTGLAQTVINEFITDANGVPVADANSRVSVNGGGVFNNSQWYDWMRFGRANTASATTGGESLATNFNGQDFPNGVVAVPIQRLASNAYNQFTATYEARSYTHDVSTGVITQNGRIGTADGNQPSNVPVAIEDATTVASAISYVDNTEAQALAEFDTTGFKSADEVGQYIRASWASYSTDIEPTVSGSTIAWSGGLTLTDTNSAPSFTTNGTVLSLGRISRLNTGNEIDTISGVNVTIDTDVVGVNLMASGVMTLASGISITGSTLTATNGFSNFPTTLDGSITFNGSFRYSSGVNTLTVTDNSNLGGLTLIVNAGATVNIRGANASDFLAVTGAGTVNYIVDYVITNTRTDGLLTVFRTNGGSVTVDSGATTTVTNILANEIVDVVYTEANRTDFLQRVPGVAIPVPTTIAVMNAPNEAPTATVDAGIFVPNAPTGGIMNITVTESITDGGEVNSALQSQVKSTLNYNTVIQQSQRVDVIVSDGATSGAAANSDNIRFIATIPANVAYIRDTSINSDSQSLAGPKSTLNIVGGGTVEVGVTINAPAGFDPAITGGQISNAIETINNNTDAELAQVTGDVREMRDNRYLGIRRQPVRT